VTTKFEVQYSKNLDQSTINTTLSGMITVPIYSFSPTVIVNHALTYLDARSHPFRDCG
jgi:hypothetical protein